MKKLDKKKCGGIKITIDMIQMATFVIYLSTGKV